MKKAAKRIICMLSAVCVAVSMLLVCDTPVLAATAPAKVHIRLKQTYGNNIQVKFSEGDYKIQNVKSSSKNVIYRVTYVSASSSEQTYNQDTPWGYGNISLYAKKKGTYTVTFDVVDKNMNVTSSHSVKVYANNDAGIKKVAYGGKTCLTFFPDGAVYDGNAIGWSGSGAFKVTMNKGYKLKSITMVTYNKSGKEVRKKIKNGAKVTLGKYRRISENGKKTSSSDNWYASLLAETRFVIEYKDKYSGQNVASICNFYRLPKN